MTSTVSREVNATPEDVWAVLSDGWLYGLWVVGASRIRDVDVTWPSPDARIHHSVGAWPLVINDSTSVVSSTPAVDLVLQARAWPTGEATVHIAIEARGDGCTVSMSEDASEGPARLIPEPVRRVGLDWRNKESLERLAYLVEGRAARAVLRRPTR